MDTEPQQRAPGSPCGAGTSRPRAAGPETLCASGFLGPDLEPYSWALSVKSGLHRGQPRMEHGRE